MKALRILSTPCLDEPVIDPAGYQRGMRKSRWFHVAVRQRKIRRVSTGQTEELGKVGKEIGGQREAVWILYKNRGMRGKVIELP